MKKPACFYDDKSFRLNVLRTTPNNGQDTLQDLNYYYDAVGNIVGEADHAQQIFYFANQEVEPENSYEYDALYRLIHATGREMTALQMPTQDDFVNNIPCPNTATNAMQNYTQNYSYDALGNILQMSSQNQWTRDYIYDTATNRLLRHTQQLPNTYSYDAHGNMLTMPHLTSINWDYLDQLHSATNGTFSSYYNYDAEGNRTRKVVVKGNIREERYYIGGYEVFRKYINDTLDYERKTINISDDEKVFVRIETKTDENPVIRYQYDNHLGSACLELDELGAIISYGEYHPFGTTSYRSGRSETEVSLKRYKYCGKERDEETGLYYYGMRYYAAWLCRFVSVDPLQFKYPYYTPYQYAGNKPISYIDLDGGEEKRTEVKKNLYVIVKSDVELKKEYFNTKESEMGTYKIIIANDIKTASEEVGKYLGDNKADNIVLDMHGITFVNEKGEDTGKRGLYIRPNEKNYFIMGKDISDYLSQKKIDENKQNDISALNTLFSYVKEGGNFVFMSCQLGDDTLLIKYLDKLSDGSINIYANKDDTPALLLKGKVQLWTGATPLSTVVDKDNKSKIKITEGWVKINKENLINLKDISNQTGSIYINTKNDNNGGIIEIKK